MKYTIRQLPWFKIAAGYRAVVFQWAFTILESGWLGYGRSNVGGGLEHEEACGSLEAARETAQRKWECILANECLRSVE